jgi:hypothetical protein
MPEILNNADGETVSSYTLPWLSDEATVVMDTCAEYVVEYPDGKKIKNAGGDHIVAPVLRKVPLDIPAWAVQDDYDPG